MHRMDAVQSNHRPLRPIIDQQQQHLHHHQQGAWYSGQFQYQTAPHHHPPPPPPQQHAPWVPPPDQSMHYGHHPHAFTPQDMYPPQGQQYPPPQRPMPPQVTHMYAQPDQAWTNSGWSHQQPWGFTDKNSGLNNEEDWAARARAWAAAKAAMEAQQAQSQFPPLGRSVEHHQGYQDHYLPAVQPHFSEVQQTSLSPLGHQSAQLAPVSISNMPTNQVQDSATHFSADVSSSYIPDGFISYSSKDGTANLEQKAVLSSQVSVMASNPSYPQEMPTNYTSVSGIEEQVKPSLVTYSPLSSPMTLLQDEQLSQVQVQATSTSQTSSQPSLQPHFTYSDQPVPPVLEVSHQQPEFEQHVGQEYHQHQQSNYLQPVPTGAMEGPEYNVPPPSMPGWPQLGGPGAHFPPVAPAIPASHQFEHPYMPVPHPIHGHPAHLFGRTSGPQSASAFRPNMPPIGGPFGMGPVSPSLAPGPGGMVGPAFMGDNNGTFNIPERPKKASVPNWLREELIKKKAAVVANASAQGLSTEDSVHASVTEGAIQSFRKADLADSKSVDSARSSDDEDDEEDEVEAARTAAINQEIKRVLTEVLLKVTDDLFDEIAQEVLDEDDHITQAKKYGANDRGRMRTFSKVSPPPPSVPTPTVSARVLLSAKNASVGSDDESGKSSSNGPGGNVLGLANYASDDDDDMEQPGQQLLTHELECQEDDLQDANQNGDEKGDQFREEEKSFAESAGVEKSKRDRDTDTDEDKDKSRTKELSKETVINREVREERAGKKRSIAESKQDSQNVQFPGQNQGFESKDDVSGVSDEREKLKMSSKVNVPKSGDKSIERYQGSSKDAHDVVQYDKGWPNEKRDREIKRKGNASIVGAEHVEMKNKKGDNKQQDLVQQRKDGGKEREREKDREKMKDGEKVKDKEKNRTGDKKRDKEKLRDREARKGSDRTYDKEGRKDFEKERRGTDKMDDGRRTDRMDDGRRSDKERFEKNGKGKHRDPKDTRKSRQRSSSVSSRGRNSKVDSYDSFNSSSGAEGTENPRRRRLQSSRRSSSPSPIRSRKRQVSRSRSRSRSSHARHSHRRHSPYPSHESRRKQSRSGSPAHRRRRS